MIQWSLWESLLETEPSFRDTVWELMSDNNQISLTKGKRSCLTFLLISFYSDKNNGLSKRTQLYLLAVIRQVGWCRLVGVNELMC